MSSVEVILVTGERLEVEGSTEEVEASVVAAARGSIMQMAWLTDAATGRSVAINPEHVVMLAERPVG